MQRVRGVGCVQAHVLKTGYFVPCFLEAFEKLRKATISFVVCFVRLSVRTEQRGSHWMHFH